jgi:hypothetical protein
MDRGTDSRQRGICDSERFPAWQARTQSRHFRKVLRRLFSSPNAGNYGPGPSVSGLVKLWLGLLGGGVLLATACAGSQPAAPGNLRLWIAERCPTCHTPEVGSVRIRKGTGQQHVVATRDFNSATTFDLALDPGVYRIEGGPDGVGCRSVVSVRVKTKATTATTTDCY